MNFKEAFSNKNILIPLLQRDYVQGSDESVIDPFLDFLLSKECDLNYIYGYTEDGAFVPVDGQQRLTTLWLLYLYMTSRKNESLQTHLEFNSREYADDFCKYLMLNLPGLLKKIEEAQKKSVEERDKKSSEKKDEECRQYIGHTLDEIIQNEFWFISSWSKNASVANMLKTLKRIHEKLGKVDTKVIEDRLSGKVNQETFSFLDMPEESGLDDDIYIKMNGRGRPLSQFENLKSWMDEKVEHLSFSESWKRLMDNRWTNLFWQNRNKTQEHPEEIDDEQLHCIANLLVLFHIKYPEVLAKSIKDNQYKEQLKDYLKHTKAGKDDYLNITDKSSDEELTQKLIGNFSKGIIPPLVWFTRLNLMPDTFFRFSYYSLNRLSAIFKEFNKSNLFFRQEKEVENTYSISMTDGSYNRTLPLLFAAIRCPETVTNFVDWMRCMRNLILNTEIEYKDLGKIIQSIDSFSHYCRKEDIYSCLLDTQKSKVLSGFNGKQVAEEVRKANPQYASMRDAFSKLENTRFFEGKIRCMFDLLPAESFTSDNFSKYSHVLRLLFNGGDKGVSSTFDDNTYVLRRALMSYPPYWFGVDRNGYKSFCNGLEEWRGYVRDEEKDMDALKHLLDDDFCTVDVSSEDLKSKMLERVENISSDFEEDILKQDPNSHRFHFIHHRGVWSFMGTKRAKCRSSKYHIVLWASNSNGGNRMELRDYGLYLDYKHKSDLKESYPGWDLGTFPSHEGPCFYFQKPIDYNGTKRDVAIDVFFCGHGNDIPQSENCYGLYLFVRAKDESKQKEESEEVIGNQYPDLIKDNGFVMATNGRYVSEGNSRAEIISLLSEIFRTIK